MSRKVQLRLLIDFLMILCSLFVMGYQHTEVFLHEWLGVCFFVLFLLHNILNISWYKVIWKTKWTKTKILSVTINILLLIAFLTAVLSGILMSNYAFPFLNIHFAALTRKLHLTSTAWCFVFMSLHLGMHWESIFQMFKRKISKGKFADFLVTFFQTLGYMLVLYGVYVFFERKLWNELFLLVEFVFLNYQEFLFVYIIKQIAMMSLFTWIDLMLKKLVK